MLPSDLGVRHDDAALTSNRNRVTLVQLLNETNTFRIDGHTFNTGLADKYSKKSVTPPSSNSADRHDSQTALSQAAFGRF
jgi:hypothetical protein